MRKFAIGAISAAAILVLIYFIRPRTPASPEVAKAAEQIRQRATRSPETAGMPANSAAANNGSGDHAVIVDPTRVLPGSELPYAIALSSFFSTRAVSGLSAEQLARLEETLVYARRTTYDVLFDRATMTSQPNGGYRIEIPSQGDALGAIRDSVHGMIAEIVGPDAFKRLNESGELGQKFDAGFGYFGRYSTTIDISFDGPQRPTKPNEYVTLKTVYRGVPIMGIPAGIVTTHGSTTLTNFENIYGPLTRIPRG